MTFIFAHRGYSALYPENTMLAFKEAEKAGADGIELDVQLTKDGEVVVIHDESVDRTTNGKGYVKDLTYNEMKKLDASYKMKTILSKEPIPLLRDVLEWLTDNRMVCNIELKNGIFPYKGMEEKVIALVRQYNLTDRVIISSFNHYSIVTCYRLAPEIETAPLMGQVVYMPWIYAESIRAKGIHPKYKNLHDEVVQQSEDHGIAVRPYTVNKEKDMAHFMKLGCSAIITDDPVRARRVRQRIIKTKD